MQDIAPDLLKKILELFAEKTERDPTIAAILEHIDAGTATAEDVQRFAIALGVHESDALLDVLTPDVLPDGKMYYNIAERTVRPTIEQSHELFSEAAAQIQKQLNENAGIGLRAVTPKLDEDRVRGIIDKISDAPLFEDVRWVLNEPIRVLVQSFADEFVKANAEFQADAGLSPTITRTVVGGCCQWCRALAGKYTYPREVPKDVYRRHAYCRCLVTYDPGDGSKRVQDVHSKKWKDYAGQADEDLPGVKIEQRRRSEKQRIDRLHPVNPVTGKRYVEHEVIITDKQKGKKIGKHAKDYGLNPANADDREWLLSYIHEISTNPDERAYGEWRYQPYPAVFHIKNGDVVVENADNEFVTLLKGGIANARVKDARK